MDPIRVILASGYPTVLSDLGNILITVEDVKVVAIARSGLETIQVVRKLAPDILILESKLPDMDASEVIRRLQDAESTVRFVVMNEHLVEEWISHLLKLGIHGCLDQDEAEEWLVPTLRAAIQGVVGLSPKVRERMSGSYWGAEFGMLQS